MVAAFALTTLLPTVLMRQLLVNTWDIAVPVVVVTMTAVETIATIVKIGTVTVTTVGTAAGTATTMVVTGIGRTAEAPRPKAAGIPPNTDVARATPGVPLLVTEAHPVVQTEGTMKRLQAILKKPAAGKCLFPEALDESTSVRFGLVGMLFQAVSSPLFALLCSHSSVSYPLLLLLSNSPVRVFLRLAEVDCRYRSALLPARAGSARTSGQNAEEDRQKSYAQNYNSNKKRRLALKFSQSSKFFLLAFSSSSTISTSCQVCSLRLR